jgi:hypothetical protein
MRPLAKTSKIIYTPESIQYILRKGYSVLDSQNLHIKLCNKDSDNTVSLSKNIAMITLLYTISYEICRYVL